METAGFSQLFFGSEDRVEGWDGGWDGYPLTMALKSTKGHV